MTGGRAARAWPTLVAEVAATAFAYGAAAVALALFARTLEHGVALPPVALVGAALGVIAARPVRLPLEDRWSAGRAGAAPAVVALLLVACLLALLGLGVLVPAVSSAVVSHSVRTEPTRRRVVECTALLVAVSTASWVAALTGWAPGVVPAGTSVLLGAALLVITLPTLVNTAEVARRERASAAALEAERRRRERDLEHAARHDHLTGLTGRRGLAEAVADVAASASPQAPAAVLFMDLDGFKEVNDALGHAAGDELLVVVARRLVDAVRPGDVVARAGGDEFVVVLADLDGVEEAEQTALRLQAAVTGEVRLAGGRSVRVGASTGVAVADEPCTGDELLARADAAMYERKRARRTRA